MTDAPPERRPWKTVLGLSPRWPFTDGPVHDHRRIIRDRFKELASTAHPAIVGGSLERMAELEAARDEALKEVS